MQDFDFGEYDWDEGPIDRTQMKWGLWGAALVALILAGGIALGLWLMLGRASADEPPMPKFERFECMPLATVLGTLLGHFHETPLFVFQVGKEDQTMMVVNQQTGTVTQIAACSTKDGQQGASVILTGTKFRAMGAEELLKFLGPRA